MLDYYDLFDRQIHHYPHYPYPAYGVHVPIVTAPVVTTPIYTTSVVSGIPTTISTPMYPTQQQIAPPQPVLASVTQQLEAAPPQIQTAPAPTESAPESTVATGTYGAFSPIDFANCLNKNVYLWLNDGRQFWARITNIGPNSIDGYMWDGTTWVYFQVGYNNISSISCE